MWRKLSVGRTWKGRSAVASLARLSMKTGTNSDVSDIAERKDRDLMFFDRRFIGPNKPVVSIRHHNKELKRDPKTTRQTAATSEGKTELECSRWSYSPCKWLCSHRDNQLSNRDLPVTNPDNNFASCLLFLIAQIDQGVRKETKTFASIPDYLVVKVNDAKTTRKQSKCSAYDNTKKARLYSCSLQLLLQQLKKSESRERSREKWLFATKKSTVCWRRRKIQGKGNMIRTRERTEGL